MSLESLLQSWTPKNSPVPWITVNVLCFASSAALFLVTLIAEDDSQYRIFAKQSYLFWNFSTTVVWCVEVGLRVYASRREVKLQQRIELAVAAYFTTDSAILLHKFKVKKEDIDVVLFEVAINTLAYLHVLRETMQECREQNRGYHEVDGEELDEAR